VNSAHTPVRGREQHTWTDRNDVMNGTMTWYPGALVLLNKAPPYTVHIISKSVRCRFIQHILLETLMCMCNLCII